MLPESAGRVQELVRLWSQSERRLRLVVLFSGLAVVAGLSAIWLLRADVTDLDYWKTLGYPGVFFLSLLASGAILVPVPGLVAVCGAGGLELNLFLVAALAGTGETVGELSGYGIGYGGRSIVEDRGFFIKMSAWMARRGTVVLFLASLIPNPVFDVLGVAAGATRFPLARFLVAVWLGKSIKALGVGYACFLGVQLLPWLD